MLSWIMFFRDPLMSPLQIGPVIISSPVLKQLRSSLQRFIKLSLVCECTNRIQRNTPKERFNIFRASSECLIGQLRSDSDIPSVSCQFFVLLTALINYTWVYCFIWSVGFVPGLKHGSSCISVLGASLWTKRRSCWN